MSGSQEDYARTRKSTKKDDKKVQEHRVDYVWREISLELFSLEKETNER